MMKQNKSKALAQYLFPYQKQWLADKSRYKIWEKSRRIGATYVQALEDVLDCLSHKGLAVWFSSADDSAAKEYILYCAHWAKVASAAASAVSEEIWDERSGTAAYSISFKNGARINAMSSNPKAFRSKGGKVVLDEFAWHRDQQALWTAARPVITWGYDMRILSTHNGRQSLFYQFLNNDSTGLWSRHKTTVFDAVDQGLADRLSGRALNFNERQSWLDQERAACGNEDSWQQEYCCTPLDETSAFLTYEMIASCERPSEDLLIPDDKIKGDLYLGFDVARKHDLSVIVLLEKSFAALIVRRITVLKNMPFQSQKRLLFDLLQKPGVRRLCIDAGGLGMNLAEDAQSAFGSYKVEPITFTQAIKEELAVSLRIAFEDHSIFIPSDADLRADLHSIKRSVTSSGHVRFDAERSETDGHADRFWALALAVHAAKDASCGVPWVRSGRTREAVSVLSGY